MNDDLTIPSAPVENFRTLNSWHSAIGEGAPTAGLDADLEAELLEVCTLECSHGEVVVWGRLVNRAAVEVAAGVPLALYARTGADRELLAVVETPDPVPPGYTSEPLELRADAALVAGATALELVVDDDGTGAGAVAECNEGDNHAEWTGPICP